ncbi:sulfatase-like hydrolase/transferase [Ruminococcaceae bacterium OttesenSCG-928-L11]|nr:sulfatase-like hydrolase/transferase [Ruminococcaceae bacterium OttesenSCG-928-L11]
MKPNLLLITTDQQRYDTIRALGNPCIRTPHLDLLTRQGITFTRAYADCPMCVPARWTIMNGLRASTYHHAYYADRVPPRVDKATSLPGLLAREGYQTQAIGKMHFWPLRARYGFDHMLVLEDYYRMMAKHPHYGTPMNHGLGQNEFYPGKSTTDETHSLTAWVVDETINFLETRDPSCPFFLWTSFSKPHPPLDPPEPYCSMYAGKPVPPPARGDWLDRYHGKPGGTWDNRCHEHDPMTEDLRDDATRAYYGLITQIDYNLGRLFARLSELKLWDNTCILFTSDHGEMLGDHGGFGKCSFFEGSARLPFIIKPPLNTGTPYLSQRFDTPVTHCDILPTLTELAGISLAEQQVPSDGVDVFRLLEDRGMREYVHGESITDSPCHFITDGRYKYIMRLCGGEELFFDLSADPREETDRSAAPAYRGEMLRLKGELCSRLASAGHKDVNSRQEFILLPFKGPEPCESGLRGGLHTPHYNCDVLH